MQELIPFPEARELVLRSVRRLDSVLVPLAQSPGRTLAEAVMSRENIPPFDNSAMDGYALRAGDAAEPLEVIGDIPAGTTPTVAVRPGTCMRIMTGAPIPDGADAVVPVENVERGNSERIRVLRLPQAGDHIRRAGGDIRSGEEAVESGHVIDPAVIAVLAALGYAEVPVVGEPLVSVVSTGTELVDVAEKPGPGQIRDSNGPALAAQVTFAGGKLLRTLRAGDERSILRTQLESALEADVLVISGGVSVGEYDFVKDELEAMGMELLFWKVRQRPGKPLAFGLLEGKAVFGLPGNPVSSAVCFYEYVRPALAQMLGRRTVVKPLLPAVLRSSIDKKPGLYQFVRGIADWRDGALAVETAGPQGSHVSSTFSRANCLIHLAEDRGSAAEGEVVALEWLEW